MSVSGNESEIYAGAINQINDRFAERDFYPVSVLEGGLNRNLIFELGASQEYFVFRIPKPFQERAQTIAGIVKEYAEIGAAEQGVSFSLRSTEEQIDFLSDMRAVNLQVPTYLGTVGEGVILEYIDGIPLSEYLQAERTAEDLMIIPKVLTHMKLAHENGIVFGDRWVTNTMVRPDGDFTELDFDIKLIGDETTIKTFELAQTLYHIVHFAGGNRDAVLDALITSYAQHPDLLIGYDIWKLDIFLQKQAEHFMHDLVENGKLYEGLIPPDNEIQELRMNLLNIDGRGLRRAG